MIAVLLVVSAFVLPLRLARPRASLKLITEPDQEYAPIYKLLASPGHSLDLTMYEMGDSKAEQILRLMQAGNQGACPPRPRFVGEREDRLPSPISPHKVKVRWASRKVEITHQKSFVVDGRAVVMTGNLTNQYYSTTCDFALMVRTSKMSSAIEKTFGLDWKTLRKASPRKVPTWSGAPAPSTRLVSLIGSAHHSLLVENEE